ncbi:unnamed protein product, partial [Linum tenue]
TRVSTRRRRRRRTCSRWICRLRKEEVKGEVEDDRVLQINWESNVDKEVQAVG